MGRFSEVIAEAKKHDLRIRGYVSCVVGCPYEGAISPKAVAKVSNHRPYVQMIKEQISRQ